jgi:hypothetical protein
LRWNKTSNDWHIHVFAPTEHPLESLAAALTLDGNTAVETEALSNELAHDAHALQRFVSHNPGLRHGARLLMVVDQFEELFALCRSEQEEASFIGNLLSAASEADGPVMVLPHHPARGLLCSLRGIPSITQCACKTSEVYRRDDG